MVGAGFAATSLCDRPWQFGLTVVVWSVGEIATAGSFQALVAALAPERTRGRYAGAVGLAWGTSGMLGPLLGASTYSLSPDLLWTGCLVAETVAAIGQWWLLGALEQRPRLDVETQRA
jgi:MFS family permease